MTGWIIILISATKVSPIQLQAGGELRSGEAGDDPEDDRDDHRDVEVVGAVALRGSVGRGAAHGSSSARYDGWPRAIVGVPVTAVTLSFVVFACVRCGVRHDHRMSRQRRRTRGTGARARSPARSCCCSCSSCWSSWSPPSAWPPWMLAATRRQPARDQAIAVAQSVADSPSVREAVLGQDPSATLQPFAEEVRRHTGTDFVVVMDTGPDALHPPRPEPDRQALRRRPRQRAGGQPLHPGVRRHARPLRARRGARAATATGWSRWSRSASPSTGSTGSCSTDLPAILLAALATLAVGLLGAWLISRRLRRQTHGLGEREITRMYEYYRAVLARRARGPAPRRRRGPRSSSSTTRPSGCSPSPRTSRALPLDRAGAAARPGRGGRSRRAPSATRPTSSASRCW